MKKSYILIVALVVLMAFGAFFSYSKMVNDEPPSSYGKACTEEAKICPDGSAVGRQGENCEFTPCPGEQPSKP